MPLDFTLTEGSRLVLPLEAASRPATTASRPAYACLPGVAAERRRRRARHERPQPDRARAPGRRDSRAALALRLLLDRARRSSRRRLGADGPVTPNGVASTGATVAASVDRPPDGRAPSSSTWSCGTPAAADAPCCSSARKGRGRWRLQTRLPAARAQVVGLDVSLATAEQLGFSPSRDGGRGGRARSGRRRARALRASVPGDRPPSSRDWRGFVAARRARRGPAGRLGSPTRSRVGQTMLLRLPQPTDGTRSA